MKKLNRRSILILVAVLSMPYATHAASIQPKSWELNGFVSFEHTSLKIESGFLGEPLDLNSTVLDLEPGVGYFLTSNWEILGTFIYEHQTVSTSGLFGGGDTSTDQFGLKASTYFHFGTTGAVIPFAGIGAGVFGNDGDTSYILPEAVVGIRWPFRDVISFNFSGGYRRAMDDGGGDAHADQFFIGAGFSVFLQGGAQ